MAEGWELEEGGSAGAGYGTVVQTSSKWKTVAGLIFFFSIFLSLRQTRRKEMTRWGDVIEGAGLVSSALVGWLAGSVKNEE